MNGKGRIYLTFSFDLGGKALSARAVQVMKINSSHQPLWQSQLPDADSQGRTGQHSTVGWKGGGGGVCVTLCLSPTVACLKEGKSLS